MSIEPSDESFVAKYHRLKDENMVLKSRLDFAKQEIGRHAMDAAKLRADLDMANKTIHKLASVLSAGNDRQDRPSTDWIGRVQ